MAEARARSQSTPERTETVDVHQPHLDALGEREFDAESPITSNTSSSPHHAPYHHQQQQQQQLYHNQPAAGAFHSLPRSGAHQAGAGATATPPGQMHTPSMSNPRCETTVGAMSDRSDRASPSRVTAVRSPSGSQEDDSLCSSEYTDPTTYPEAATRDATTTGASCVEEAVSRDSYELLSDSDPIFMSPHHHTRPDEVPYLLHRRLAASLVASKSCDTVIHGDSVGQCALGQDEAERFRRSRSFRSLREKTYRERPSALFARARLVEIDLSVIDPEHEQAPSAAASGSARSLVRPKSIEFVAFQNLPPPDAFSSRDDTLDPASDNDDDTARDEPDSQAIPSDPREFVPSHFTSNAEPSYPVVVRVSDDGAKATACLRPAGEDDVRLQHEALEHDAEDDDKMCSLMSQDEEELPVTATSSVSIGREQGIVDDDLSLVSRPVETEDDEALTADDVRDVDLVYQDTLSSTSLEEQLLSEDQIFEFVNEDDGLPDPDSVHRQGFYGADVAGLGALGGIEYVFQTHVLSRISERSGDSRDSSDNEDAERERNNTMSDVSSSFKAPEDRGGDDDDDDGRRTPLTDDASESDSEPSRFVQRPVPPVAEPDPSDIEPTTDADDCCLPPPPSFDEATPVNEMVPFDPPLDPSVMDDFPSPPSSIDNLPEEDDYSDSSS